MPRRFCAYTAAASRWWHRHTEHLWKTWNAGPALKQLLDKGVFRYAAVLSGREQGKVQTLRRVVP